MLNKKRSSKDRLGKKAVLCSTVEFVLSNKIYMTKSDSLIGQGHRLFIRNKINLRNILKAWFYIIIVIEVKNSNVCRPNTNLIGELISVGL